MKINKLLALLVLAAFATASSAQVGPTRNLTLAAELDLDGLPTSLAVIVVAADVADSTSYAIATQPDSPRKLVGKTVGDNSCIATLVGTAADGTALSSTLTWTAATATITPSPNSNFATVTSFITGVCTGEAGGETIQLGTVAPATQYALARGTTYLLDSQGTKRFAPWKPMEQTLKVKTTGSSTTVVSNTASSGALGPVSVGSILSFDVKGDQLERVVTAKASADSITVDAAINLAAGYGYWFRNQYFGPDTEDGWINVGAYEAAAFTVELLALTGAANSSIVTSAECRLAGASSTPVQVGTAIVLTLVPTNVVHNVDLRLVPYSECRVGLGWDADGDEATDTTTLKERINVRFAGTLR